MRAHKPPASIVLNEFQWMHHTYAIAAMSLSSVGICDRGDGTAPGGRGRQRDMSGTRDAGIENTLAGVDMPFAGVCDSAGSFGSDMASAEE